MPDDTPTPLATAEQMTEGPLADLVRGYEPQALADLLLRATRRCESECDRRLAPFANVTETQRADALDVEDALDVDVPLDPVAQLGYSRALSLGSTSLVRHFWVRHFPPHYTELWSGSIASITLRQSYAGILTVDPGSVQFEQDTGHVRFALGTFVPQGTTLVVVYSGGYATVPADLVHACTSMAGSMAVRQLDPSDPGGLSSALRDEAYDALEPYTRDPDRIRERRGRR